MNDEYIEVDSLKEIREDTKTDFYLKDALGNYRDYYIHKDKLINPDYPVFKKNPNYKKLEFNKYVGKRCVNRVDGNTYIIHKYNTECDTYQIQGEYFSDERLNKDFIIEGINDND